MESYDLLLQELHFKTVPCISLAIHEFKIESFQNSKMCGRFSLSKNLNQIKWNCQLDSFDPKIVKLENLGMKFEPSYNVSPLEVVPVLTSAKHFDKGAESNEIVLTEMMWGIVPRWHKGNYNDHEYSASFNSRVENLEDSKMYSPTFKRGRRCVMVDIDFLSNQVIIDFLSAL